MNDITNAKILVLLAAMFLASAFATVGSGQWAQAEEPAEKAEERAERRAEKTEERAEERREKADERREEAQETTGGRAEGTGEQTKGTDSNRGDSKEVTLRIKGDPKTEFSGTCTVGDKEYALSGQVPQSFYYSLDGQKLECEIRKQNASGSLKIILTGNGIHAVQQIDSTGTLSLTYDGNSISSSVSSSSSSEEASSSSSSSQAISSS